ncbi:hypothetical protein AAFF_G00276580 [Aldrovandia affinis]|uniref:Sodium/calcium exchanger 1 n=1 Tax=Aldrovandia affinis TaxID=143900 RepID=A0AAD7RAR4_9TELE|nr:hypothetical protein AAFF_G00276580 [Aldrovandia affinis]
MALPQSSVEPVSHACKQLGVLWKGLARAHRARGDAMALRRVYVRTALGSVAHWVASGVIVSKIIKVKVIDDEEYEKNKTFYVEIGEPRLVEMTERKGGGSNPCTPPHGPLGADATRSSSSQARSHHQGATHKESRAHSAPGTPLSTRPLLKTISITILDREEYDKHSYFYLELQEPAWRRPRKGGFTQTGQDIYRKVQGRDRPVPTTVVCISEEEEEPLSGRDEEERRIAEMGRPMLGEHVKLEVVIEESYEFKNTVDKLIKKTNLALLVGTNSWRDQFIEAITVSAGEDDDDDECGEEKLPPASTTSCTSSRYTFASKVAAIQDQYADASIGNVTGSNAVNVFLGIGVAWSIAAIYHQAHGKPFRVDPGTLAFSVTLFTIFAFVCVGVLMYRRRPEIGGELGGARTPKIVTAMLFVSLWFMYILLSSLEAYCHIKGF